MSILIHGNEQYFHKAIIKATGKYNHTVQYAESPDVMGSNFSKIKSVLAALCFQTLDKDFIGVKALSLSLNTIFDSIFIIKPEQNSCKHKRLFQLLPASNPAQSSPAINNFFKLDKIRQKQSFNLLSWISLVDTVKFFKQAQVNVFLFRTLSNSAFSEKEKVNVIYKIVRL